MPTKDEIVNFSLVIEDIAELKSVTYIDAIIIYCENTGLEVEVAAKLISNNLKSKLEYEASTLNLVKKSNTGMLPI